MENKVMENARESLSGLSGDEKREALRALRRLIDEELFGLATEGEPDDAPPPDSCPRCGSWKVAKRGRDAKGGQRYLCKACGKSFSGSTLKVFATTKLDHATWMRYAECHVDLDTLREVQEKCGVSLKTAWFMRHRVLEAIALALPNIRPSVP